MRQFVVSVNPDDFEALRRLAFERRVTRSSIVRELIENYLFETNTKILVESGDLIVAPSAPISPPNPITT